MEQRVQPPRRAFHHLLNFSCRDRPNLFFFDLLDCAKVGAGVVFTGCPTPQVWCPLRGEVVQTENVDEHIDADVKSHPVSATTPPIFLVCRKISFVFFSLVFISNLGRKCENLSKDKVGFYIHAHANVYVFSLPHIRSRGKQKFAQPAVAERKSSLDSIIRTNHCFMPDISSYFIDGSHV